MREVLHKYPSTQHLAWLGRENVRDDKVLTPAEVRSFLSESAVVEEKVDGANLGLSFGKAGELRFQNRGNWLARKLTRQWESLRVWAADHEAGLRNNLPSDPYWVPCGQSWMAVRIYTAALARGYTCGVKTAIGC